MKAPDWVVAVLLTQTAVFWSAAGLAAADGSAGGAFAYSVVPVAVTVAAGPVMLGLERKQK